MTAFAFDGILSLVVVLRCLRGAWPVELYAWAPLLYRILVKVEDCPRFWGNPHFFKAITRTTIRSAGTYQIF